MHVRGQKLVRANLLQFNSLQNSFPTSIESIVGYITHHGDYPTQPIACLNVRIRRSARL